MLCFWKNEDGATAIIFALALLPLLGSAGVAIDYGRAMEFREFARQQGDVAALAVAAAQTAGGGVSDANAINAAKTAIQSKYGDAISGLTVTGAWINGTNYQLKVAASLKNTILAAVPGMPASTPLEVETIVNVNAGALIPEKPKSSQLSHEAIDYNRIYMYCYNEKRKNEADKGRSKFVAIADNADPSVIEAYAKSKPDLKLVYADNKPPECGPDESVSYMLRNVRGARMTSSKWDNTNQDVYEYYTDTTVDKETYVMKHNMAGRVVSRNGTTTAINMGKNPMLETVICSGESECKPRSQGGILPNEGENKGRTPVVATGACSTGKSIYFGWEDRLPDVWSDGSDQDYDDIRVVVDCPKYKPKGDKIVRIVK